MGEKQEIQVYEVALAFLPDPFGQEPPSYVAFRERKSDEPYTVVPQLMIHTISRATEDSVNKGEIIAETIFSQIPDNVTGVRFVNGSVEQPFEKLKGKDSRFKYKLSGTLGIDSEGSKYLVHTRVPNGAVAEFLGFNTRTIYTPEDIPGGAE